MGEVSNREVVSVCYLVDKHTQLNDKYTSDVLLDLLVTCFRSPLLRPLLGESLDGLAEELLAGDATWLPESESDPLPDLDLEEAEEELEPEPLSEPDPEDDLELFWLFLDSFSEADEFLSESEFSESLKFDCNKSYKKA
jgi:hypothetical protein